MKYKEFELILSSFRCDKNCPYCTAKITKWPIVEDRIDLLPEKLQYLKDMGINFRYFILSGNGEPSLHNYDKLKEVVDATRSINIFDEKRVQTSGNLFFEPKKFELFKNDFLVEITRTDFDSVRDMQTLGYKRDYIHNENFKYANIRLNYVMLKNRSFDDYMCDIQMYIDTYPNVKTVSLKTLNTNTRNNNIDNGYSSWIMQNALTKHDTDSVIQQMSERAEFMVKDEKIFDRYEWKYRGVPITFYAKKLDYGYSNVVYYGGNLVDYKLNLLKIAKDKVR